MNNKWYMKQVFSSSKGVVIKDVPAGKTVLGYPAQDAKEMLKQWVAMRKLV